MYNNYFGFSESPFENNLDQRFLFFSANYKEVSAAVLYFITLKKGFAMVCGDAGTGKTLLVHYLLSRMPDSVRPIMIASPDVGYIQILQNIAGILEIDTKEKSELDLIDHIKTALMENRRQVERFVLIVEDAHLFSYQRLEQIRLLSNIETSEHKLFQILLLGQCALSHKLNRFEMRQVCQRININRFLAPMDAVETIQYIDHRLKIVDSSFDDCFELNCRRLIFKMTKGVPLSINQLCDSALLTCMTEEQQKINGHVLKKAAIALRSQMCLTPWTQAASKTFSPKTIQLSAAFGTAAIMWIVLGIYGYQRGLGERARHFLQKVYPSTQTFSALEVRPISETDANLQAQQTLPKAEAAFEKESVLNFAEIQMQSIGAAQALETQIAQNGSGELMPEMNLLSEPPASQGEKTSSINIFPLLREIDVKTKFQAVASHVPQNVVVKNGDTLIGIACRFFPENPQEGVKKIRAANPLIHDISRIHPGQKLIMP